MRKLLQTLSGKLTLCSIAMMLCMWLAVGIVLVLNTANEIMEGSMDLARIQAQKYRFDSYMQTNYSLQALDMENWWINHGCEIQHSFLFPRANSDASSRYLQYNLSAKLNTNLMDWDFTSLPAHTFVGIRAMAPRSGVETGTFLSLEQFSARQLYEISKLIGSAPETLPSLTATGTREGLIFQVDTLTLGSTTFRADTSTEHQEGENHISLNGGWGEPSPYALFPTYADTLQEWELFLGAEDYALGGYRETENSLFRCYAQSLTTLYQDSEALEGLEGEKIDQELIWLNVVVISTPLKTALEETGPVLLQLLILVPVLGLLFSELIRRMVVLPLQKTQKDFQKVAALDFTSLNGDERRRDEIGALNRSLRKMSGELQRRWNNERALEQRRREFVSAASHELKTPLALMRGYTEGLAQNIGDREEYLANMEREIDRMNGLVLEMLEQTRLEGMEYLRETEPVNLTTLVQGLLTQMAPLFGGLRLSVQLAEGITLPGDRKLLERGIGNLLSNAARYCSPGGRIRISLAPGPVFTVENDTSPIPEEELPRLFEMFYRGDKARDRSGSGMGLAIAQRIFSLHHMICKAENIDGGVRFILSLSDATEVQ